MIIERIAEYRNSSLNDDLFMVQSVGCKNCHDVKAGRDIDMITIFIFV